MTKHPKNPTKAISRPAGKRSAAPANKITPAKPQSLKTPPMVNLDGRPAYATPCPAGYTPIVSRFTLTGIRCFYNSLTSVYIIPSLTIPPGGSPYATPPWPEWPYPPRSPAPSPDARLPSGPASSKHPRRISKSVEGIRTAGVSPVARTVRNSSSRRRRKPLKGAHPPPPAAFQ